ncbi:putative calmodulin-like protein 6 [Clonorchis sinensis]|uniref:Calmodulin-like protein 6 n=1 Tax=Clonorchis sinensis TaxID=79923 RepID=A0A419QAI0_CLOSI|nr:putative calmodulin-like protein 6 [Clonorchis sinensis]
MTSETLATDALLVQTEKSETEKPQEHSILSTDQIKKLYDSNVTPGTRGVPLKRICKILQLLGQAPTEKDIKNICDAYSPEGLSQKATPSVKFEEFCEILTKHVLSRDELYSKLFAAFRIFDPLDVGVIDATKLRETLLTVGECFTEKEAREFIKQANPTDEGKLPYEPFVRQLVDAYPPPKPKQSGAKSKGKSVKKTPN